jgi:hypothetical protein
MFAPRTTPSDVALLFWQEIKLITGTIVRKGWRPAYCWIGAFIPLWAYVVAPQQGIQVDLSQVNVFSSIILGAFIVRGVERIRGVS